MATMIVDAAASQLEDTLSFLIKGDITMMVTVKEDLKNLESTVRMIHNVLEDAERKAILEDEVAVSNWLLKLRDAFYDADDIIDNSRTDAERMERLYANQQVCCWTPLVSIYNGLLFRHRIGGQIRSLNARLEEIFKEKSNFNLSLNDSKVNNESMRIRRDSDPDVEPDIVGVGIENNTNELVRMMISSNSPTISVYGIVGMGGIGKTTLAQKINNHQTIRDNFQKPTPMWVSVSKDNSDKELLKTIIRHAGGNSGLASETGELQHILGQTVLHKKIFLVLDDIWDANIWKKLLRKPLLNVDAGSILLITSRDEGVARGMDAVHLHSVQPLSDDDGWSLICKIVFRTGEESEMQLLQPLGKQIVQKCHGHPLALKSIAGVLHDKGNKPNAWNRVLQNPAWSMTKLPEGVMGVLYLSYEDLQPQLKQCFIFCSLLPKDQMGQHILIQYWVASGFVKECDNMIMEDVAEEYYKELLRRNLLQKHPHYYSDGGCTMHDLLHSLAKFLAREYFIGDVQALSTTASSSQTMKLRHLSISDDSLETCPEIVKEQTSVRTLFFKAILTNNLLEDLFQRLKCLRLLDLSGMNLKVVPESISSLVHLRYLNLSDSEISRLPETIGNLSNLQYLILQRCEQLSELPKSITNLYNLRSIDLLHTQVIGIPVGIGQLIHLNRVIDFVTNERTDGAGECYSSLEDLKALMNLRAITIVNLERAAIAQGSIILKDKTQIKGLQLSCSSEGWPNQEDDQEDVARIQDVFEERLFPPSSVEIFTIEGYFGMEFPTWMKNRDLFLNLTKLEILMCRNCSHLPPLGQLPLLDYLYIKGAWSIKHVGPEFMGSGRSEAAFPKLKTLGLKYMPEWEEWTWDAKDGARVMPVLDSLEIDTCPRLKSLPQGLLHHATNLSFLDIRKSHSLTAIEGFKSVEKVFLGRNYGVKRVSDLPAVKTLVILDCPALLHHVGGLPSLQCLEWGDSSMRFLPDWLLPHPVPIFPTLQWITILVGDVQTLRRCLKDGPDWPKIQHIPNVSIEVMYRPELFISYTKEPFSFRTNIDAVVDAPSPLPDYINELFELLQGGGIPYTN